MFNSKIIGTGSYVPKKTISNDELSQFLDTSDEWIKERTGILNRHVISKENGENASFMALNAAKKALEMAGLKPGELDLIIVATMTPDDRLPSAACVLQDLLGAHKAAAFDIAAACAGSVYGLNIAHNFIALGQCKNALFVGVEVMSSILDWQDRNTAVLFGDGASAAVLTKTANKDQGFIDFKLYADGRQRDTIQVKGHDSKMQMKGRETYKFAVRSLTEAAQEILAHNHIAAQDLHWVVPHQANLRIIEAIAERLSIPMDKFLVNLDRYANTSAASLILALDEAFRSHKIKEKDLILMMAIGAGFTYGCGLYRV